MVTFSTDNLLAYSCVTCGAKRFKPCVRLPGGHFEEPPRTSAGTPYRWFCHANRHNKATKAMRDSAPNRWPD